MARSSGSSMKTSSRNPMSARHWTMRDARYYRLTRFGRRVLAAESARLEDLVRVIHAKRGIPERKAES